MADTTQTYRCAYCGSAQESTGTGAAVCTHCGATQPAGTPHTAIRTGSRTWLIALSVLACLIAGLIAYFLMHPTNRSTPRPAVIVDGRGTPGALVAGTRIVRVDDPHIRIIAKGVEFKPEDLIDTPEGSPAPPDFDTSLLAVRTPRRLRDENLGVVFLGEVTNTSPTMVAIAPTVTLSLTRSGKPVDKASRSFADLVPGAHVPVFFHYDGEAKSFDGVNFIWGHTKAYDLGDARHPRVSASVQSQKQMSSDDLPGRHIYKYAFERVNGNIVNEGSRTLKSVSVYLVLRDAEGLMTGFSHIDCSNLSPGESRSVELSGVIMGNPVAKVEILALPVTPPSL